MNKTIFEFWVLFTFPLYIIAQNKITVRDSFNLTLMIDETSFFESLVEESPYFIKNDILTIYPTESLNIEVNIKNDSISTLNVVKNVINPDKTIQVNFTQFREGRNNLGMVLKIKNPFDKYLIYKAARLMVDNGRVLPSNVLPIPPGKEGVEIWEDIIFCLYIGDWKLLN